MTKVESLLESYYGWLRDETHWKEVGKFTEITVPFLDRHNDHIQVYLKKEEEGFLLTDGGETIGNLIQEGCNLRSPKRRDILKVTLNSYGVQEKDGNLQVLTSPENFASRKHALVQAMLSVNDMFYLTSSHVASVFSEDIRSWLEEADIRYSERVSFSGISGYIRSFDFLISKSKDAPERIIKAVNHPDKNRIDSVIMDWLDTKDARPGEAVAYAFLNDRDLDVSDTVITALLAYEIQPIGWKEREKTKTALAA